MWQFAIYQLYFRFRSNVPHDTRSFGFNSRIIRRYRKYIEVADGHHVTAKQKGQVRIQMCDDNGKTFIATLYKVLLAPELCDRLFSIITLMNAGHTCLFQKGFCTVYFGSYKRSALKSPHSAKKKHDFTGKIKNISKKINFQQERKLL